MPSTLLRLSAVSLIALLCACEPAATSIDDPAGPSPNEQAVLDMALQMRRSGNFQGAAGIYQELLSREQSPLAAYIGLASMHRRSGNPAQAVAVMRQAETKAPDDEKVLLHLGYALIAADQPEEAVKVLDLLTAVNHDSSAGYNAKAVAFDHAGNHVAAQELYQKALRIDPSSVIIQNNLALSMILNDEPDAAIALLEPLAQQAVAHSTLRQNLALAYGLKGDIDKARSLIMQDVSSERAEENLKFYKHYAQLRKKQKLAALSPKMDPVLPSSADEEPKPVVLHADPGSMKPASGASKAQPAASVHVADSKTETEQPDMQEEETFWGYESERSFPSGVR